MLTLRQRIFLIISIVIALLLAVLLAIFYTRREPVDSPTVVPQNDTPSLKPQPNQPPSNGTAPTKSTPVPSPAVSEDLYIRQVAKIFVERFTSFSNQDDNKHVTDTLGLATPVMQQWMKAQIVVAAGPYRGTTTEVLSTSLISRDAVKASVRIETQQVTEQKINATEGPSGPQVTQKKGRVDLLKVDGAWKVDGLYWDK